MDNRGGGGKDDRLPRLESRDNDRRGQDARNSASQQHRWWANNDSSSQDSSSTANRNNMPPPPPPMDELTLNDMMPLISGSVFQPAPQSLEAALPANMDIGEDGDELTTEGILLRANQVLDELAEDNDQSQGHGPQRLDPNALNQDQTSHGRTRTRSREERKEEDTGNPRQ